MPDVTTEGQTPDEAGVNQETSTPQEPENETTVDIQAEIKKAVSEVAETFKKEIAGLNRKNSELQNELKKKELEGKSEAEQAEALRLEKENIEREIAELNRGRIIDRTLDGAGLPLDFAKRITGDDEQSIEADVQEFKTYIDNLVKAKVESTINEKLAGKAPAAGSTPGLDIDGKIREAQAKGDFVTVMALKEQKRNSA